MRGTSDTKYVIDGKKAHLKPECKEDVYIESLEEAGGGPGMCGKLVHWLYGCKPAAQAWESLYAEKMQWGGVPEGRRVWSGILGTSEGCDVCVSWG